MIKYPILHYANTPYEVDNEFYKVFNRNFLRNIDIHSNELYQFENSEFLIDYAYPDLDFYAFSSGFVPKVKGLICSPMAFMDTHIIEKYEINEFSCLTKNIIEAYSYIFLAET
jgi:hypothetical protein